MKRQYGTWTRDYMTVQEMVNYLQECLLENGLSLNQMEGLVVIKYVRRPADRDEGFTAIKVEYEVHDEAPESGSEV